MKHRWIRTAGIVLACAVLLGVPGFFALRYFVHDAEATPSEPLHTTVFVDSARMDVLAIDIGSIRQQQAPAKKRWLGAESSGHSGYAHGFFHGGDFTTRMEEKNGVKAWSAKQDSASPLLIGLRLHDSVGRPLSVAKSFSPLWLHEDYRFSKPSRKWYAPAGALAPGRRILLALTTPLENDLHVFPIGIPVDAFGR